MYSIQLGQVVLEFERALIHVPCDAHDAGELTDVWIDAPQRIDIHRQWGHVKVIGLDGFGAQRGEHCVTVVEPALLTADAVKEYLVTQASRAAGEGELVRQVLECTEHACGQVFCLNWSALGYAPGGRQYCLLPHGRAAISTGFLRLDWDTVLVREA
jgi:hypothetical protein